MKDISVIYLDKAEEDFQDAKALLDSQRYSATVSRCYYAMFHAAQALLLSRNVEAYTHAGVNIQFHRNFIKTGIFSVETGKSFTRLYDRRIKSDYEIGFRATKEDASSSYEDAEKFTEQIKRFLERS
jgi:uncharacterized protein (UPF0332 family)